MLTQLRKLIITLSLVLATQIFAEDGYRLWLRYDAISDNALASRYASRIAAPRASAEASETMKIATEELQRGLSGLLGEQYSDGAPALLLITPDSPSELAELLNDEEQDGLGTEGYLIKEIDFKENSHIAIAANSDQGILYGAFAFLRHLQTNQSLEGIRIVSSPKIGHRLLNHWDNLTRTIERTMVGASIWNWFDLPYYIEPYYHDYARACASVGINGTVLTNVNANATVLRPQFLEKVAALADTFRPYGIRVYLTARFSAPVEIGGLETADPLDPAVIKWWTDKIDEIYTYVPDFGGFVVKANSEGQPGPQNYGRDHADGANLLARALKPHGGIVMWRAFVYDFEVKEDRHKQAYTEFTELDGRFESNVSIQTKNGAIDFMPREPFHPLFGATPETPHTLELQITQEYLGGDVHLAFLAPMWKETLESDTFARGPGSTVAKIVDGTVFDHDLTAIAGVANIGNERNWTGHPLAAANWYAFGRLAWDHQISSEQIADEWTRMTFGNDEEVVSTIESLLLGSHQTVVDYSMPLGLHHIMYPGHHYGPAPWWNQGRPDWTSVYYHRADQEGIGFDRTASGTDALGQYAPEVQEAWGTPESIPHKYLLWFHHVKWDYEMPSGRTLWDELCYTYQQGVEEAGEMVEKWKTLEGEIDQQRFARTLALLKRQHSDAAFWRDACLAYFQTFSDRPIPEGVPKPEHDLEYYKNFELYHVPGHPGEQW
ncbi:alpha-glucuronidase family glycosyl hydrolase [Pelagicoccus sp. SDUM812003]|uniref:alpha-glucuronidase family glycosyl hydrolase n=1 Tax=Pelagicoccus sp. SDUM812003 TaxID=3041267 RepID=UPI0028101FC7|nr:alpha-glucuronidase family glycosyl hydrolase [Pelagicoccus sp. SDUM812003]MDQ8203198.1 alpha-glucuronidase family glycosyl hydrolase [Pelagicoccus sp. SDUM812003]